MSKDACLNCNHFKEKLFCDDCLHNPDLLDYFSDYNEEDDIIDVEKEVKEQKEKINNHNMCDWCAKVKCPSKNEGFKECKDYEQKCCLNCGRSTNWHDINRMCSYPNYKTYFTNMLNGYCSIGWTPKE